LVTYHISIVIFFKHINYKYENGTCKTNHGTHSRPKAFVGTPGRTFKIHNFLVENATFGQPILNEPICYKYFIVRTYLDYKQLVSREDLPISHRGGLAARTKNRLFAALSIKNY